MCAFTFIFMFAKDESITKITLWMKIDFQ